ncbi:MAG: glycosyltransferase family 4 protein [Proteobacteria bacterium]|nr:glycosyltransferase family 4 protein [Pseudomonadota bacterium]
MRLAIIRQRYTPFGGAERFVEGALEALLERDVAITLYTREWPQTSLGLIEPHIVDPFFVGSLWRDWSFARGVCRAVGSARLDLVQSHERLACCDIYRAGDGVHAVWLAERDRDASALGRLGTRLNLHHRYLLAQEKRLFASPWLSAVICNSQMVRDEIRAQFGVPENKLHVIYNAVDAEVFKPAAREVRAEARARLKLADDAVVFLLVGSGYARKGVATAIRALATLPAPAHLVVVGRDKRLARYAALARSLKLSGRVTITGPQTDTLPFYAAADAFVLPTLYDPCPNAALEAMACGLPVVTSRKCGAAEIAQAHAAGLVADARDVDGFAAHMRTLLDAEARAAMGANALAAVAPLTPSAMTLQLVLLYKELLAASVAHRRPRAAAGAAA